MPSMSCCVFDPGLAHMSSTRWPGRTSRTRGGTIDTSSCREMLPASTSAISQRWKAPSVAFDASSSAAAGAASSAAAAAAPPSPSAAAAASAASPSPSPSAAAAAVPSSSAAAAAPSFRATPLPRSTARETLKRHASRPGYQPIGSGGGTRSPSTSSAPIWPTNSRSIDARSATAPGSSAWPMMRKAMPSGRLSAALNSSHSAGGTRPCAR